MSSLEVAHKFFANYILVAQYFGAFPVCGVTSSNHNKLNFKWRSFKTCYSLLTIFFGLFNSAFEAYHRIFSSSRTNLARITPVCYRIMCIFLCILLFRLSMQWQRIIAKWSKMDAVTFSCNPPTTANKKINVLAIGLFISQAIASLFFYFHGFYSPTTKDFITVNEFILKTNSHIFSYFKSSVVLGICLNVAYTQWFLLSVFCEVFVIAVSLQLSSRFEDVRGKMKQLSDLKIADEDMWLLVRENYGRLSDLCAVLNEALGNLVTFVLANNTMMLLSCCYKAAIVVQENSNIFKKINYLFAVVHLLFRIICVCFCATGVETQNRKSVNLLLCLPIQLHNEEVARLSRLFNTTTNVVAAFGHFSVNRTLVLTLIGAGLSYVLVLLQYSCH